MFTRDCGTDGVCNSDLQLQAAIIFDNNESTALLIDDYPVFEVEVKILNKEETAYLTYVTMEYPDPIQFSRSELLLGNTSIICLLPNTSNAKKNISRLLECDLMSPVTGRNRAVVVFRVRFYALSWPFHVDSFNISVEVKSASNEKAELLFDNAVTLTVPVEIRSHIELYG